MLSTFLIFVSLFAVEIRPLEGIINGMKRRHSSHQVAGFKRIKVHVGSSFVDADPVHRGFGAWLPVGQVSSGNFRFVNLISSVWV